MAPIRALALFCLYWLLVTPVGALLRVVHDPLHVRWDRNAETYWDTLLDTSDSAPLA